MDSFTRADFDFLAAWRDGPCASIFVPTHRKGEIDQDPIRLTNGLREAEGRLERDGRRRADFEPMFAPVRRLIGDQQFWQYQDNGLAVFVAPELFRSYCVPLGLLEFTSVAKRFHLKPLIPVLNEALRFYILALTQKHVAFYEGDRDRFDEINLEGVPTRVEDVAGYQVDQPGLQLSTRSPQFGGGVRAVGAGAPRGRPIYHGQAQSGGDEAARKDEIRHFFERLDSELWAKIQDHGPLLVLTGIDYMIGEFRVVTKYPNLHNVAIDSGPESLSHEELHRQTWGVVSAALARARAGSAERFHELLPREKASAQVEKVIAAAHDRRIDRVFVAADREIWGTFDPATRRISLEDGPRVDNYDLLDDVARETIAHDGEVFVVPQAEVPQGEPLAATFRW
jgi:hypothetical protein